MESESRVLVCLEQCATQHAGGMEMCFIKDDRTLKNLVKLEDQYLISQSYFDCQPDLKPYMRKMVVHWMVEVCDEQGCHEDVIIASVNYLDRALTKIVPVKKTQLQPLAAACMFIASKFKDTQPISAQHLVMYTDWSITTSDLMEYELLVLQALKWELSFAGPYDFLDQLLSRIPGLSESTQSSLRRHSSILIILCIVEPKFLVCPPSLICGASLCAAAAGLLGESWCKSNRLHRIVRQNTSVDKETLLHHQREIEELLTANVTSSNVQEDSGEIRQENSSDGTPIKSQNTSQRQPCTPTDVLDIHLVS